jgi:hypothetical protein
MIRMAQLFLVPSHVSFDAFWFERDPRIVRPKISGDYKCCSGNHLGNPGDSAERRAVAPSETLAAGCEFPAGGFNSDTTRSAH